MKIDSSTKPLSDLRIKENRSAAPRKAEASSSDEVQLSALSARMSTSTNDEIFDSARVSEIKQAIAEGRFSINASAIADRLLSSARELVDAQRKA